MDEKGIKQFYSDRVPLSGRLSDYALLIGQNNRVLSHRSVQGGTGSITALPPNPNRVTLSITATVLGGIDNSRLLVTITDRSGVQNLTHLLLEKFVNALGTEIVSVIYSPLFLNIVDNGTLIQGAISIAANSIQTVFTVTEGIMTPVCCDYIGGMQ